MYKKLLAAATLACVFSTASFAQRIMHSLGATISILSGKYETTYSSNSFTTSQSTFTYFPRYNFVENDNSSFSVGVPLSAGVSIASSTLGDDVGVAFAYDLPVVVDYNIGCKSTSDNESNFGGYFGVGFGYFRQNISQTKYSDFTGATYGPMVRLGVRFGSQNERWNGHGVSIGVFYKKGLESTKLNTFGFNIMYDL